MSLNAFGGDATFVKVKFRDGIGIFVKVEICYIFDIYANPTSHISHRLWSEFACNLKPVKGASPYVIFAPLPI